MSFVYAVIRASLVLRFFNEEDAGKRNDALILMINIETFAEGEVQV